jgi:hypothetical protein
MYILLIDQGRRLVTSDAERLCLYDVEGEPRRLAVVEQPGELPYFDQSPAGERIASAAGIVARSFTPLGAETHWTSTPTKIGFYAAADLAPIRVVEVGERLDHDSLALSPDGSQLASVSRGGGLAVFDAKTGERRVSLAGDIASGTSFSPNGHYVALGETDQGGGVLTLVELRPAGGGEPVKHELPEPKRGSGLNDSPFCSRFTADGTKLIFTSAAWGLAGVVVYDVATREELWSAQMDMVGDEEAESWPAPELELALDDALVLVGQEGLVQAFAGGEERSPLEFDAGDSRHFAADSRRRGIWITRKGEPVLVPFPADWVV